MTEIETIPEGIKIIYSSGIVPDEILFADRIINANPDTPILMKEALNDETKLKYMCGNSKEISFWYDFTLNAWKYAKENNHPELMDICGAVMDMIFETFGSDGFIHWGNLNADE